MTPRLLALIAALALAACQPASTNTGPNINTAEPPPAGYPSANAAAVNTAEAPPAPAGPFLTAEGYGPLRVGMTWEEAHTTMPTLTRQVEEQMEACYTATAPELPGVSVMFEDRKLARVSAWDGSTISVAEGLRVGQPAAEVERVYAGRIANEPHHYEAAPARYLTVWTTRGQRGVRFEINSQGLIGAIHGGGPQIEYIEGCA